MKKGQAAIVNALRSQLGIVLPASKVNAVSSKLGLANALEKANAVRSKSRRGATNARVDPTVALQELLVLPGEEWRPGMLHPNLSWLHYGVLLRVKHHDARDRSDQERLVRSVRSKSSPRRCIQHDSLRGRRRSCATGRCTVAVDAVRLRDAPAGLQERGRRGVRSANLARPIGVAEWETKLVEKLPDDLRGSLPAVEEIEAELSEERTGGSR